MCLWRVAEKKKSLWLIYTMEYHIRIRILKVNNFDYKVWNSHENHIEWTKSEKKNVRCNSIHIKNKPNWQLHPSSVFKLLCCGTGGAEEETMLLRLQGRIPGIGSNLCKIYSCLQILWKLLKQHASNYCFFFSLFCW